MRPQATYPDSGFDITLQCYRSRTNLLRCRPYSVLLPVGFTLPSPLPDPRCALTAPFHPCCPTEGGKRFVLCGTFPGVAPAGCYPAPYVIGARTFLPRSLSTLARAAVRPTDGEAMRANLSRVKSRQLVLAASPRGTLMSSASSVSSVERSATPSTRSGRKWRWNAVTTSIVGTS